ncbi:MAG: AI-2E family transporter [Nevskiales bacterium]
MSTRTQILSLVAAALLLALLYFLQPILLPFVLAAGLAYLGDPLVDWLQRQKLSRTAGVIVVFLVLALAGLIALLLILPLLQEQLLRLVQNLPAYLSWIYSKLQPWLAPYLPLGPELNLEQLRAMIAEHWAQAGGVAKTLFGALSKPGLALIALVGNVLLVPVVTFYLLRDWDILVMHIRDLLPRKSLPTVTTLAREADTVLSAFLRGQMLVMLALSIYYSITLSLVGLDLALLIGIAAGLISFVPYLGFIVGIIAAGIAIVVQTQELLPLVWILLIFGVGQVLESFILTPLLVGDRIGLHPVAVIFAVLAGGALFGFLGVLLALPVAAVLAVLLRYARRQWVGSELYQTAAPPNGDKLPTEPAPKTPPVDLEP